MCRLSIFGVIAALVYVLGVCSNADDMARPYESGILARTSEGEMSVVIPRLSLIVLLMNVVLAARLYLHAWAVDEMRDFRRALRRRRILRRAAEWTLRLFWVAGIAWLPEVYRVTSWGPLKGIMSVHLYLFGIALLVLLWDGTMKDVIFGYTKKDKGDLIRNWLVLDVIMAVLLGLVWVLEVFYDKGSAENWRVVLIPASFVAACVVSLVQLCVWLYQILESAGALSQERGAKR